MERRSFLKKAGVGVAASTLAAPAIVRAAEPHVRWRLASSFPQSLDTIYGAAETMAKHVAAATGGKFQIQVFAGGEIVPPFQVLDAVKDGTVELGHTASYYYVGKDPTFAFDTTVPFGVNARQQNAWIFRGGGLQLLREFFRGYNIYNIPCGNTGAQMGGWFRKEIPSLAALKGIKMRIGGWGGQVMARIGAVPQMIPGGDIYPSLEKGTLDAAEWVGPYDDEKLGFQKVCKYYYYPGWWEGQAMLSVIVNHKAWDSLPKAYQTALEDACAFANIDMQAKYDAQNPAALKRLVAGGTQLRPFSRDIMEAAYKATNELFEETAAKNAKFKKIYEPWKKFRADEFLWFRVAENTFDNFMYSQRL